MVLHAPLDPGDFETTRAVSTGRRVAAEYGDATDIVATTEPDDF